MIGSVSEAQAQLADLEKRRQAIAAQSARAGVPAAVAEHRAAAVTPVAGYTSAQVGKSGPADIAKRKKKSRDRDGREMPPGETALDAVGEGMAAAANEQAAADDAAARKGYQDRGIMPGPARPVEPGRLEPGSVDRDYLSAGHASESPQAGPPRQNPMPNMVHAVLPDAPMAARIPPHVIAHYTSGSPSER